MALTRVRRFGTIEKMVEQADGTLQVFGVASTEDRDAQGEIITAAAMKAAIPGYMEWGAVREMHQPKAAGTALETSVDDKGRTMLGVHVVDPVAVEKCRTGVYKGFSVGGIAKGRDATDKKTITDFEWIETSLVDRPANPSAKFLVVKMDGAEEIPLEEPIETTTTAEADPASVTTTEGARVDVPATKVAKGMYDVKCFGEMLESLAYMAMNAARESFWEGDASSVPAKLRAWVAAGAAILQEMTAEESAELIASMGKSTAVIEMVAKRAEVTVKLTEVETVKAALAEAVAKVQAAEAAGADAVAKVAALTTERDAAVAKVKTTEGELKTLCDEVAKMIETMKADGRIRAVPKEADTPASGADETTVAKLDPKTTKDPIAAVSAEVAKIHRSGGRLTVGMN